MYEPFEINEANFCYDKDNNEWIVTLLNKHAYSQYITETDNAKWYDIIFMVIKVISPSFLLYALYRKNNFNQA